MVPLTEKYEHIGEVEIFVQDMTPVWERERDHNPLVVRPEEATMVRQFEFPVSPVQLWDYVTKPETFAILVRRRSGLLDRQPKRANRRWHRLYLRAWQQSPFHDHPRLAAV